MREEVGVEGVPALFVAAAVEGNAYDLSRLRLLHTACCFTLLYSALLCFTLLYSDLLAVHFAVEGTTHDLARLRLLHTAARHVTAYLRTCAHIYALQEEGPRFSSVSLAKLLVYEALSLKLLVYEALSLKLLVYEAFRTSL
jgi:hypothetical protein